MAQIPSLAATQAVLRANMWLANKRLGDFATVEGDVHDWDVSALDPRFKFMKDLLLDELDSAFAMTPALVRGGILDGDDLLEWPALTEMRADERFEAMLENLEYPTPDSP